MRYSRVQWQCHYRGIEPVTLGYKTSSSRPINLHCHCNHLKLNNTTTTPPQDMEW
uniref:Uncharacterized protein n=1 Tax=Anguilla anguilla TaxID=7936 RepID=A0A0E9PT88_ANGAN